MKVKTTTQIPPGIASPDKVEKFYDDLDFQRAAQACLRAIPAKNQTAMI